MANLSSSSSPSCSGLSTGRENLGLDSTRAIVRSISEYILDLVGNANTWISLKQKSSVRLSIQKENLFAFSECSILSNLYWGIESIEAAIQPEWSEEKMSRLMNSESMLQMPALLDEHGTTAEIPNTTIISFSYFYLSIVSNLQDDAWQAALHFLQSVIISPELIRTDVAPEFCQSIFSTNTNSRSQELFENMTDEDTRQRARKYRYRITYYQVMLYRGIHQSHRECKDTELVGHLSHYSGKGQGTSVAAESSAEEKLQSSETSEKLLQYQKVHHVDFPEDELKKNIYKIKAFEKIQRAPEYRISSSCLDQTQKTNYNLNQGGSTRVRCLNDILKESQSDASTPAYDSGEEDIFIEATEETNESTLAASISGDGLWLQTFDQKHLTHFSKSGQEGIRQGSTQVPQQQMHKELNEAYNDNLLSRRPLNFIDNMNLPILDFHAHVTTTTWNAQKKDASSPEQLELEELLVSGHKTSTTMHSRFFAPRENHLTFEEMRRNLHTQKRSDRVHMHSESISCRDLWENLETILSEVLGNANENYVSEVTMIYQMLNKKRGVKYNMLKDVILEQLLKAISTSKEKNVIKASVTILTTIISVNKAALEDIKEKGLQLSHLASALKQNVQEAATLIYLIKPSPTEIKSLELLPALVDVACNSACYKARPAPPLLTPPAASLMIIEVLITAFDHATNKMHLAAISSPNVLSGLLDVAKGRNLKEFISLASILVKCMQFDGVSKKYISAHTQVAPFVNLLQGKDEKAKFIALQFLHEVLQIPRSSAIKMLQQIKKEIRFDIKEMLLLCIQQLQPVHQLLAADILLQLNALDCPSENKYRNDAMRVLLEAVTCSEVSNMELLSTFILSNLGGTYAWTGEPYTTAWLLKKGGLTSLSHRNMLRNISWSDECLQDSGIDGWCSKVARSIIKTGKPLFHALQRGLKSENKRVSRASLTATAWLSIDVAKNPNGIKYSACEILLEEIEQFLHPGLELEERLLACLCIYNYASGKGIHKLIHCSEGVRESLRRLSHVTWMADELHKATDYLSSKARISCVHTQVLEMRQPCSGAVTALTFHKGLLYSGHLDGSIKVWDVSSKLATLLWDIKEHKSTVTCFSLYEPGESILSGSADKTIRIWQINKRKLECAEVITTKEPIRKLEAYGKLIFVITKGHKTKLLDPSRTSQSICKGKSVKCMAAARGKIYMGCTDSSIQELTIANKREKEIRAPTRSWRIQNKSINSIVVYQDCLYSTSTHVEISNIKDMKRSYGPQISITAEKGANIIAMGIVEDFIYLNRSSSTSTLQIWLRRTQQKVGRLSAGSKITSLLTANDIVLCGTEAGIIKGWIPL